MKKMKVFRCTMAILIALCLLFAGYVMGANSSAKTISRSEIFTNDSIVAVFDKNYGTLAFSGNGIVERCDEWITISQEDRCEIYDIVFHNGISEIASNVVSNSFFRELPNLQRIYFEDDVSIGGGAFACNPRLRQVTFFSSCREIGFYAFGECPELRNFDFASCHEIDNMAFAFSPVDEIWRARCIYDVTPITPTP